MLRLGGRAFGGNKLHDQTLIGRQADPVLADLARHRIQRRARVVRASEASKAAHASTGLTPGSKRLLQSFLLLRGEQFLDLLADALIKLPIDIQVGLLADLVQEGLHLLVLFVGELDASEDRFHVRPEAVLVQRGPLFGREDLEDGVRGTEAPSQLVAEALLHLAESGLGLLFLFLAELDRIGHGLDPDRRPVIRLLLLLLRREDFVQFLLRFLHGLMDRGVGLLVELLGLGDGLLVVLPVGLANRLACRGKLLGIFALELLHRLVTAFDNLRNRLLLLVREADNRVEALDIPLRRRLGLPGLPQKTQRRARYADWVGIWTCFGGPEIHGSRQNDRDSQ